MCGSGAEGSDLFDLCLFGGVVAPDPQVVGHAVVVNVHLLQASKKIY